MELVCNYMDCSELRHLLNEMTREIFGFSFENWYNAGYFAGEYIPYSYVENGKIIANASVNIMKFMLSDQEKFYIQIGTVMTRPEYRNRGLARKLIEKILVDYMARVDGFYLFANLRATEFYKKIGFQRLDQWRWYWDHPARRNEKLLGFEPAGKNMRDAYVSMLNSAANNADFDHINRCSLQMFYTMDMENVYYCEELDCFVVMHIEDQILYLDSVISSRVQSIHDIVPRINGNFEKIVFGFVPKERQHFRPERYDGSDDYRFCYLGSDLECIECEKLFFPVMSHA